ncbi:MAG TPA: hypothetical protein VGH81_10620 [Rudaea sp.]|jgi:hypothetical protein
MTQPLFDALYRRVFGTPSQQQKEAGGVVITRSGSAIVDRELLHKSEGFKKQVEALEELDSEMRKHA